MAYDPADLRLPGWLLRLFDALIRLRLPLTSGWSIAMTRAGVMFMLALIGVWAASFYSGNNLLYLCGAVLTGIVSAAVIQGMRLLRRMPAVGDMKLPLLEVKQVHVLRQDLPLPGGTSAMIDILGSYAAGAFNLQARCENDAVRISGRLRASRRGVFQLEYLRLQSEAPLGLFNIEFRQSSEYQIYVLPEAVPWQASALSGAHGQGMRDGDEWRDLRSYVPGDALSRVHWRKVAANARTDTLAWTVKRFADDESNQDVSHLRVDLRIPPQSKHEDFERLLGKAWFWLQQQRGRPGSLMLGRKLFDIADEQQINRAMRALASCRPETMAPAAGPGLLLSIYEARI